MEVGIDTREQEHEGLTPKHYCRCWLLSHALLTRGNKKTCTQYNNNILCHVTVHVLNMKHVLGRVKVTKAPRQSHKDAK